MKVECANIENKIMPISVSLFDSYGSECHGWYVTLNFEDIEDLENFIRLNPDYTPSEIDGEVVSEEEKERYEKIKKGLGC